MLTKNTKIKNKTDVAYPYKKFNANFNGEYTSKCVCLSCGQACYSCRCKSQEHVFLDTNIVLAPQSGETSIPQDKFNVRVNLPGDVTQSQILAFNDQNAGWDYHVPSELDSTYGQADNSDDSLQQFFSRPVKIRSFNWGTGTRLFESFNPWQLFWENPRNINRISNYNLLRCKMCLKIVINGNGFHYGRAIASYTPLHTSDNFTKDRAFFKEDIVEASQRPHIYLDPTNSQGGTMCLPFVWKYNALSVPKQEWRDMGQIVISTLQNLKHANGADDKVTVAVFAWAEDVVFSTPTSNEPGALVPQSGEAAISIVPQLVLDAQSGEDEYGDGLVSRPASVVAKIAGKLSSIPMISPYARATEIGASAVGNIAKIFGFSRPVSVEEIIPYKPQVYGNTANTSVTDTSSKLTYDIKQELTCDTRTMGLDGTDEMALKSIASRESYLTSFNWAVGSLSEDLLWNCQVTPLIWSSVAEFEQGILQKEYHLPACCYAVAPFRNWKTTMKYRFQIVASAFHKGRLKIVYEPSGIITSNEYNTNFTRIIDLAKERDFTVEIGWGQPNAYCRNAPLDSFNVDAGTGARHSSLPITATQDDLANGILAVYVVNDLTVPNSAVNNDIGINVFVSAGDDFDVVNPDESLIQRYSFFPEKDAALPAQSGEEPVQSMPDATKTTDENAPSKPEPDLQMAATMPEGDMTQMVYFGDPITSVRQLLKRYNFSRTYFPNVTSQVALNKWTLGNFPSYRGFETNGYDVVAGVNVNLSHMTMLNYFTPAFACRRGGLRWKYHHVDIHGSGSSGSHSRQWLAVNREPTNLLGYGDGNIPLPNTSGASADRAVTASFFAKNVPTGNSGAAWQATDVNPVLEVELPFYRNQRFAFGKNSNQTPTSDNPDMEWHSMDVMTNNQSTSYNYILSYCAAGDDYTLGFYTSPPVVYMYDLP